MRFGVLGPLTVWASDGTPVPVPERKVRALLARLLIHPGRPVSASRLVDGLWGTRLPQDPANALQGKVSQLRRALERGEPGGRRLVVSGAAGYALDVDPEAVDAGRFAALVRRARDAVEPGPGAELVAEALGLWRGAAFADFGEEAFARAAIERLEEERLTALEDLAEARLALGEHRLLVGELADQVARHPLRERLRALHMRVLSRAGRQPEALRSYGELRRRLATELGLDPGPELTALRDEILRQDQDQDQGPDQGPDTDPDTDPAEPNRSANLPSTNLPAPLTELIGRENAVEEVRGLLRRGRLVTLTGPGGVGKSRLAIEAARGLAGDFGDGVWLVELAGVDPACGGGAADVVCAVMQVLGIPEEEEATEGGESYGPGAFLAWLTAALRGRRLLLVLDNCEQLVEPVAELAEALLRGVPGLRVLVTSREPLRVGGELLSPVPPLEPPAAGAEADVLASSAARLFLARVGGTPPLPLTPGNAEVIALLCRRLDGLPLALELAASRVRTLGLHGLAARLDDRFSVLTNGYRDAPARQRTLHATLTWSWELLTEAERAVLRRLAVHVDGCSLRAAEEVCAGGGVATGDVLDLLGRLVDRSLVVLEDRPDGPRYRLLESVREFGAARLREAGGEEEAATRLRHRRHYAALAERAAPLLRLRGREQRRLLALLDAESGNLRRALDLAVEEGATAEASRLVSALAPYWELRGRYAEARRSLALYLGDDPADRVDSGGEPLALTAGRPGHRTSRPASPPPPAPA